MAVRYALVHVCPVLVALLLATLQWAELTHAARTGSAFVKYFALSGTGE